MKKELILIAREAGKTFLKRPMTSIVAKEGHANYVTNIDCMVQEYLEKELRINGDRVQVVEIAVEHMTGKLVNES